MSMFLLIGLAFLFLVPEMLRRLGEYALLLAVTLAILLAAAARALGVLRWWLRRHQASMRSAS